MFIAQSQWKPLDPVVVSNFPAHWATNVPVLSPIVLRFSESMDTNSVQTAFSTAPPVLGSLSWSASNGTNDTMTFTPNGTGLPGSMLITVRIGSSAVGAVSGNAMHSAYQMQFMTAPAFQIVKVDLVGDGIQVTWSTVTNLTYQLQSSAALGLAGSWTNVGAPIPGTGGNATWIDGGETTNGMRYYRVRAY
jgi:hypothetical protein